MIARNIPYDDDGRALIIPFRPPDDSQPDPAETITLRRYYDGWIFPLIQHQSKRSLESDRNALNHWERHTHNRDIREVDRFDLEQLRDGILRDGSSEETVNKVWRELAMMLGVAEEEGFIARVPKIGIRMKSRLVRPKPKIQRETVCNDEVEFLWRGCAKATYPSECWHPSPKVWRVAIVLFYVYGPRTSDVFARLTWDNVKFRDRMIQFEANKTHKLQGLPLTDLVADHLRSIRSNRERIFHGFNSSGCLLKGEIKRGYRATWRFEIGADDLEEPVRFKHFRESMITRYNSISSGRLIGNWIAAHQIPGVSAQNYDLPTKDVRDAIEAATVPDCFKEID